MTVFQELAITLQSISVREFISRLERHVKGGWSHDSAQEGQLRQLGPAQREQYCFTLGGHPRFSPVSLWLVAQSSDRLAVANILSRATDLSAADFNAVLGNFVNLVARPAVDEGGASYTLSPAEVRLDDLLPADVAEKLRRFSRAANKVTGSSHPNDFERWLDFLGEAHRRGCKLSPDLLGRWLREDEGWPEDVAAQLVRQYEFGEDLLHSYDRKVS